MSSDFIQARVLCVELNCDKWFLRCLSELYGLRELGHSEGGVYLVADVKEALIAHHADGRPTKHEMERRIKARPNVTN